MRDSNPRHPACKAGSHHLQHASPKELTASPPGRCTLRCTENDNGPMADPIASFVASLTTAERQRLAELLSERNGEPATE